MSKTTNILKQLQADAHAMFVKIHNYHWNVEGMDFFPIHNTTEEIYNDMATLYDDCAERVIQLGEKPYLKISDLAKAANIKEENGDSFKSRYIVEAILSDYKYMLKTFQELSEEADKVSDKVTAAFADDLCAKYEKQIWMLGSMLK